jgi:hypothetical protein
MRTARVFVEAAGSNAMLELPGIIPTQAQLRHAVRRTRCQRDDFACFFRTAHGGSRAPRKHSHQRTHRLMTDLCRRITGKSELMSS